MTHLTHAKTARAGTRLSPEIDPEFQIAPLIDILLVLLVFFMSISSTELLQKTHDVQLPTAAFARTIGPTRGQMIVNIPWIPARNSGVIEMDGVTFTNASHLLPKLEKAVQANAKIRVLIRADKSVRYEFLRPVMVAAGQAGIKNVTFSVVDRDSP